MKNFISDLMSNQTRTITLCGLSFKIRYSVLVISEIVKHCAEIDFKNGEITKIELKTKKHDHKTYLNYINNIFSPTADEELKTESFIFFIHQGINLNKQNLEVFEENGLKNGLEMEVLLELFRQATVSEIERTYEDFVELFSESLNMSIKEQQKAEIEQEKREEIKKKQK